MTATATTRPEQGIDYGKSVSEFEQAVAARMTRRVLAAVGLVALAALLVLIGSQATASRAVTLVLLPCALASYVMSLLLLTNADRPSSGLADFRLGAWVLAFGAASYGLATMSLLLTRADDEMRVGEAGVPRALLAIGLGFTVFAIGYRFGPTRLSGRIGSALFARGAPRNELATGSALTGIYLLGIGFTALKIVLEGGYGYVGGANLTATDQVAGFSQLLTIGTFLRTAALYAFSASWAAKPSPRAAAPVVVVFGAEAIVGVLFATKESFVVAVLAVLIPVVMVRARQIPWRLLFVAVLLFIFVVTPLVTALRGEIRVNQQRLDAASSLRIGAATILGGDQADVTRVREQAASRVASRIRLLDNQVVIMDKTPNIYPYRDWTELAAAPITGLIPRAVWPDKPLRLSGLEFYKTYYQGPGVSSSALTFQGSLFLYGGIVPPLLGMLMLGTALRGLDETTTRLGPMAGGLLVLVLFIPIVKQELEAPTLLASVPIFLVTFYLSRMLVLRPQGNHQTGATRCT